MLQHYVKRTGIALVTISVGIAIYVLLSAVSGLLTVHDYSFRFWGPFSGIGSAILVPWALLTPLALWFSVRVPLKPANWVRGVSLHLLFFLVLTLLHGYAFALRYHYSGMMIPEMLDYEPWQHTGHFLFLDDMFLFDALIYIFLIASQNISNFHSLAQQRELDALRMQGQLTESRLQTLLMQVNPHFLFNTLNSIAVLVKKQDTEKAGTMINHLSDFFRQTLEQSHQQMVPLSQELALIEKYLAIEKVRFGARLTVDYRIDPAALHTPVLVLLLQPLVENAIKHGLARKTGPCHLQISVACSEAGLDITVCDDGIGTSELTPTGGTGLRNVQARLRALYQEEQQFSFSSTPGAGTVVRISLQNRAALAGVSA